MARTIILLSMEARDGVIWETFDDERELIETPMLHDFKRALERQA